MNILLKSRFLAVTILALFALISCKSTDNTIVIEDAPVAASEPDTGNVRQPSDGAFQQLTIGETNPIHSLDPLFAENAGSMRMLQLMYEGLVRYDENGEITPTIAQKWTVSSDELTYRFNLHTNIFYHDSDIFTNGLGRKLTAADIKFVFERMAKADVPDKAAQLFMNILGFEPYFQEQHQVMIPAERQLSTVRGIKALNDSTITFTLVEPDPDFINKLATPYALIYPREAVKNTGFKAVGSGPFHLSQKRSDSLYILAKFDNYRRPNQPKLDRVDIRTSSNATTLLNALNNGDIQLLPELGPEQMQMVLTSDGQLKSSLNSNFKLYKDLTRTTTYALKYNEGADIPEDDVISTLDSISPASLFSDLPKEIVKLDWNVPKLAGYHPADTLKSLYSDDPFIRALYATFSTQLAGKDIAFNMQASRVLNRNIDVYINKIMPIYVGYIPKYRSREILVQLDVASLGLSNRTLENLNLNAFLWWMDLRSATFSSATK